MSESKNQRTFTWASRGSARRGATFALGGGAGIPGAGKLRGGQGLLDMFESDPARRSELARVARMRYQKRAHAKYQNKLQRYAESKYTATGELIGVEEDGHMAHTWDAFALRSATRSLALKYLPVEDKLAIHRAQNPVLHREMSEQIGQDAGGGVYDVPMDQVAMRVGALAECSEVGAVGVVDLVGGLTEAQVRAARRINGPNSLPAARGRSLCLLMLKQLVAPINLTVVLLAVMSTYKFVTVAASPSQTLGVPDYVSLAIPWAILSIVVITNAMAEANTGDTLKQLATLTSASAKVIRGGVEQEIDATELVPGDVVVVETGDTVPADMRVLKAVDLACVEASLTGEPIECTKHVTHQGEPGAAFKTSALYSSTGVVGGKGRGVVTATGVRTVVGQISGKIGEVKEALTPLQKTMQQVGGVIILVATLMVAAFTIVIGARGDVDASKFEGSVWVAALFEGLNMAILVVPTVLTIIVLSSMKIGVKNLSAMGVQMRRLTAVETLGAATVICSDKTGTLTAGKMTAVEFQTPWEGDGEESKEAPTPATVPWGFNALAACHVDSASNAGGCGDAGQEKYDARCEVASLGAGDDAGRVPHQVQVKLEQFTLFPQWGFDPTGGAYHAAALDDDTRRDVTAAAEDQTRGVATGDGSANRVSVRALWGATYLNCDRATMMREDKATGAYDAVGNMSEAALVVGAAKAVGLWDPSTDLEVLQKRVPAGGGGGNPRDAYPEVPDLEVPFASKRKMKLTVHALPVPPSSAKAGTGVCGDFFGMPVPLGSSHVVVVKGAPDRLLPHLVRGMDVGSAQGLWAANEAFADQALRVLVTAAAGLAPAAVASLGKISDAGERLEMVLAGGLSFLGMIGLKDPPRDGVKESISMCHNGAVRVVMITGDQISTASAISTDLSIIKPGQGPLLHHHVDGGGEVLELTEVDIESGAAVAEVAVTCGDLHLDPSDPAGSPFRPTTEIDALTETVNVFARAQPTDKIAIVESFRRKRDVVVMTGDGVNDAAALKAADIGVSMGIAGTAVAKEAADMILVDDSFTSIVTAIQEGRRIFSNLQKLMLFFTGSKGAALIQFGVAIFAGLFAPMGGVKSMVYWFPCVVAMSCILHQHAEPYLMSMPPRNTRASVMTKRMWLLRSVPCFFIFQVCVLVPVYMGKYAYAGNLAPVVGTDQISQYAQGTHNCLYARHRVEGSDVFARDDNPVLCSCPDQRATPANGNRAGNAFDVARAGVWWRQFGSTERLELSDGSMDDRVALINGFSYDQWLWGGTTGGLYNVSTPRGTWERKESRSLTYSFTPDPGHPSGINSSRVVLRPCNSTEEGELPNGSPLHDNELCWTADAEAIWGGAYDAAASNFPEISSKYSCGAWALRKSNTMGWMAYSWTEITYLITLRTETPLWTRTGTNDKRSAIVYTGALLYVFLFVYIPPLAQFAETIAVPVADVAFAFAFGIVLSVLLQELFKWRYRHDLEEYQVSTRARLGLAAPGAELRMAGGAASDTVADLTASSTSGGSVAGPLVQPVAATSKAVELQLREPAVEIAVDLGDGRHM